MRYIIVQNTDFGDQVLYDSTEIPPAVYNIDVPALWKDENGEWNSIYRVPGVHHKRVRMTTRQIRALNNALALGLISQEEYNRKIGRF